MVHIGVDIQQRFCYLTPLDARGQILWQGWLTNDAASLRGWLARWAEPTAVSFHHERTIRPFPSLRPDAEEILTKLTVTQVNFQVKRCYVVF